MGQSDGYTGTAVGDLWLMRLVILVWVLVLLFILSFAFFPRLGFLFFCSLILVLAYLILPFPSGVRYLFLYLSHLLSPISTTSMSVLPVFLDYISALCIPIVVLLAIDFLLTRQWIKWMDLLAECMLQD